MKCLISRSIISGNIISLLASRFLGGVFWKVLVVLVFHNNNYVFADYLVIRIDIKKLSRINVFGFLTYVFLNLESL